MPKLKTVQVGSHIALVSFGGANVPVGFLASHRKKHHADCAGGGGFVIRSMPGQKGKVNVLCDCATTRAVQKLKKVGVPGFEQLAGDWLAVEKIKIEENRVKCQQEGYDAAPHARCPYPEKTDQALAWCEGHKKKAQEEDGSSDVQQEHEPEQGEGSPA